MLLLLLLTPLTCCSTCLRLLLLSLQECTPTKKDMVKKLCSKKCALSFETPKVLKGISEAEQPNPSKPPTAAAATAEAQLPSLDLSKSLSVNLDASKAEADVALSADLSTSGRRLQGLIAHKVLAAEAVKVGAQLLKSLPVPACDEVCEDVHFEVPDLECHEVTHTVQSCKMVPEKVCEKECVCIPQKSVAVNLPKVLKISSKDD